MQDDDARERVEHEARGMAKFWIPAGSVVHFKGIPFAVGDSGVYVYGTPGNAAEAGLSK